MLIDIGNTNVVLGCIADGKILFTERMATDSGKTELDYAISLKMVLELREIKVSEITGAIIGSVVPPVTSLMREAIRKVTGQEALVVNVDMNIGLDMDITIRCFGEYSYQIANPVLFYTNVCGNVEQDYTREEIDGQLKSELMTALQPAFAKISAALEGLQLPP